MDDEHQQRRDRKSTRLNSSHLVISYAVFCLKKNTKKKNNKNRRLQIYTRSPLQCRTLVVRSTVLTRSVPGVYTHMIYRLLIFFFFFLINRRPQKSPLFPYPPLSS